MPECPTCGTALETEQGVRIHHTRVHETPLPNRVCKGCEQPFYDPRSDRVYCDGCNPNAGEHNPNWKDAKEEATCKLCESTFDYYPSDKQGVYCPDCVEAADEFLGTPSYELREIERVEKECELCEKDMTVLQSEIDRGRGRFCSEECRNLWLRNEIDNPHSAPYHGIWHTVRKAAYKRDEHQCQWCGTSKDEIGREPDAHHIKPIREFEDPEEAHRLDNIICLCKVCHRRAEIGLITEAELWEAQGN